MRLWQRRRYYKKNRGINKFLVVFLVLVILFYMFSIFDKRIRPTVLATSEVHARYIATAAINQVVYDQVKQQNLEYNDLITLQKDKEGRVTALQANVLKMNEIKSDIALLIQEKINNIGTTQIRVPIGTMLNIDMFSTLGPKLPIRMIPIGSSQTDFESVFTTAGINQTRHQISLVAKSRIKVLLPVISADAMVETSIPIAETILIGVVPDKFIHLEGEYAKPDVAIEEISE